MVPSAAYVLPNRVRMSGAPTPRTAAAETTKSAICPMMSRLYVAMLARSAAASAVKESVMPPASRLSVVATCQAW